MEHSDSPQGLCSADGLYPEGIEVLFFLHPVCFLLLNKDSNRRDTIPIL